CRVYSSIPVLEMSTKAGEFDASADRDQASLGATTTGFFAVLPDPLSLDSGAPAAVAPAFEERLQARYWSEATPEYSIDAWLVAGITNELDWPILPGEAFFYIDGQLASRRPIEGAPTGEDFELALGRNENVVIERKERLRTESQSGLIDKTRRHALKFETTVTNRMPIAHEVVLRDRFPVSQNNKIQIDAQSPRNVEVEEGTGIFRWEREIAPGASAVLETEYTITYPAEWTILPSF
ncbi:MAG: DUF4139 domain-containing protein, partial [Opitutales bacterium]